jgi:hypothetical protein
LELSFELITTPILDDLDNISDMVIPLHMLTTPPRPRSADVSAPALFTAFAGLSLALPVKWRPTA